MSIQTLNDVFFATAARQLDRAMLFRGTETGAWNSISSSEFRRKVAATAKALHQWGIRKGDRIAILSENRPEWAIADFAMAYVQEHARTPAEQQAVLAALRFKCDVLWAQLDALHHAYVTPALPPPGALPRTVDCDQRPTRRSSD